MPEDDPGTVVEGSSRPTEAQHSSLDQSQNETVTIHKIQELLKTKNDTSRFVGLALLKSVLDNSPQLREDEAAVTTLWQSVSPKFLDRLLRSGSQSSGQDAKNMIDIAVAVLHTFSTLLPEHTKSSSTIVGRIPALVPVILHGCATTPHSHSTGSRANPIVVRKRRHSLSFRLS